MRAGDAADDVLGDGEMERFLAAEVIDDGREIGAGRLGDLARGGALEAEPAEHVERRVDQLRARLGAAVALGPPIVPRGRAAAGLPASACRGRRSAAVCPRGSLAAGLRARLAMRAV